MSTIFCFGIIPLRCIEGEWQVFLIRHVAEHWAFPKGHPIEGETHKQTATRELKEETGFSVVNFLDKPTLQENYRVGDRDKTVTYFLAEVEGEMVLNPNEIQEGRWESLSECHNIVTFSEARKMCLRLQSFFSS